MTGEEFVVRDCELWALSEAVAADLGLLPSQVRYYIRYNNTISGIKILYPV